MTLIESNAFYNTALKKVTFPEGLTTIESGAFAEVPLASLTLPSSLKSIGDRAFLSTSNTYKKVVVPEGVVTLGSSVFLCDSLHVLDLPSTLVSLGGNVLSGNLGAIEKVIIRAANPPAWNESIFTNSNCHLILYVPKNTVDLYKSCSAYNNVDSIAALGSNSSELNIFYPMVIAPGSSLGNIKYDVNLIYLWGKGYSVSAEDHPSLEIQKGATLKTGLFCKDHDIEQQPWFTSTVFPSFVNRGTFTFDNIDIRSRMYGQNYFTPPFDVAINEIVASHDGASYNFYRYNPEARAASNYDQTWVRMNKDEVLKAGQGYCYKGDMVVYRNASGVLTRDWPYIHLSPTSGGTNYFAAKEDITLPLSHNSSEFAHDCNWNLIGMPYPAFLDIRGVDFDGPIIVYSYKDDHYTYPKSNTWTAYSPLDDEMVLKPMMAFFVQAPDGVNSITFDADRRQFNKTFVSENEANSRLSLRRADLRSKRKVYNLYLSTPETTAEGMYESRTRFVINPDATTSYDIGKDAPQLNDADGPVTMIYTESNGLAYAINERPLDNGIVRLGMQVAAPGSYTLSLSVKGADSDDIWLVDNEEHTRTLLSEPYTFTVEESGVVSSRFLIAIGDAEPTAIDDAPAVLPLRSEGLFNLAGQRVNTVLEKGVYIENGKKVLK